MNSTFRVPETATHEPAPAFVEEHATAPNTSAGGTPQNRVDRRLFPFSIFHSLFSLFFTRRALTPGEARGSSSTDEEVHIIEILP